MIHILIADDHAIVRRGLKQILDEEPGLAIVSEAENGQDVLDMSRHRTWDLVILDINLPGRSGIDILNELHYAYPKLPVLILSMYPEDQYALRVLNAGASGYLTKQSAPEELVKAIKKIRGGGKYYSDAVIDQLVTKPEARQVKPTHEILSDREFQVMVLIASGKTLSEIGENLALSIKTVSTYRKRILTKLNMKNNAELIHFALKNNLVE
jgi:DNA-binding NarL/FixJ family response regulator